MAPPFKAATQASAAASDNTAGGIPPPTRRVECVEWHEAHDTADSPPFVYFRR